MGNCARCARHTVPNEGNPTEKFDQLGKKGHNCGTDRFEMVKSKHKKKGISRINNNENDRCLIQLLPWDALEQILLFLDWRDLTELSITCSQFNDSVFQFLYDTCTPERLVIIDKLNGELCSLILMVANNVLLLEKHLRLLRKLTKIGRIYWRLVSDKQSMAKVEYYQLLDEKEYLQRYLDAHLTGVWHAKYWQYGRSHNFKVVVHFNKIKGSIYGFSEDEKEDDRSELHFAIINGSFETSGVRFEKTYIGRAHHTVSYEGSLTEELDQLVIKGHYWGSNRFEMVKSKY